MVLIWGIFLVQSVPSEHIETHKLASIVLEYRRECHSDDVVESLTSSKTEFHGEERGNYSTERCESGGSLGHCCEFSHLLRTQEAGQQEILRGRTTWRARGAMNATS